MTCWTILTSKGHQAFSAGVPYLAQNDEALRYVAAADWAPAAEPEIILGAHTAPDIAARVARAPNVHLYETENVLSQDSPWQPGIAFLRSVVGRRCLNYSSANATRFDDEVRPLRPTPALPAAPRDLARRPNDVFFAGCPNSRRLELLTRMCEAGLKVDWAYPGDPVFGNALALRERQAKVVLNVHYYLPGVFEAFRCVPAVSRGSVVFSEDCLDGEGRDIVAQMHPYRELVDATVAFCRGLAAAAHEGM